TLVDFLAKAALLLALWIIAGAVGDEGGGGFLVGVAAIASFLVWSGYDVAFETLASGRTPGKRVAGLRVVRLGGEPVGFLTSAVRNLLRLVDMQPGLLYAVGAVTILFSRRNQRLGDLAAGTLVVRERRAPLPAPRPPVPDFAVADRYAAWDVSAVTSFELVTVRRFLERRGQLDPAARARLGWDLAERLRPKVAGAPPGLHPEHFLEAVAEAKAAKG
ncbi:MAG TPA: RDD family protein, partial [Acidimicrobiia bacterium]|nr:RDD family protein [Acidimicrobiia bacterium]